MDTPNDNGKPRVQAPPPRLIDADGVAALLSVSKATVWWMRDAGKLPASVKIGACVRWRVADIEAWLADGCPSVVASAQRR